MKLLNPTEAWAAHAVGFTPISGSQDVLVSLGKFFELR